MSDIKKLLKKEVVERRYNRMVFVESILNGRKLFYQGGEVDITNAVHIAALNPECQRLGFILNHCSPETIKQMWMDGSMAEFSAPIHRAVLSLADTYIGEEL